jgi:hypothetical protein
VYEKNLGVKSGRYSAVATGFGIEVTVRKRDVVSRVLVKEGIDMVDGCIYMYIYACTKQGDKAQGAIVACTYVFVGR